MIAFISGRVVEKTSGTCVLEVGGVGLRLAMPTGSVAALPTEGDSVTVHTYLYVRPEELSLFGFESLEERRLFELLLAVSGVGPKVALAALSSLSAPSLTEAIAREDVALISSVPGIGKKTAQRIILDLKDRLGLPDLAATAVPKAGADAVAEASEALLAMGFSSVEVSRAMKGYEGVSDDAEALLKHALKRLGGGA